MTHSPARRTRVKICGITNQADAEQAIEFGADALGFNTWRGTKRYLDVRQSASWLQALPPFVSRVALTVNAPLSEAGELAQLPYLDALQFHGDEDETFCASFAETGKTFVKALRIQGREDFANVSRFSTPHLLVDAHVAGQFGGTGVKVDLELAAALREAFPNLTLILAGGLRPENVAEAVRIVRPYGVDVSSGVESVPGRKDAGLLRAFIDAARGAC